MKISQAPLPAARTTLADDLRRQLADDIVAGRLLPGVRLDEQELATRFGVSRTPVREALRQLAAEGLAEARPRRGVVVSFPTPERLAEMFEVMAELEAACARFAALRMTVQERRSLDALHVEGAGLVRLSDLLGYEALNLEFHQAIYRGSHNVFLEQTALSVRSRLMPFRRAQFRVLGRLASSHAEHALVVEAIQRGDGECAYRAMRAHMGKVGDATADYVGAVAPR
jgi:DNA-binding GntR family transcriptional regulator